MNNEVHLSSISALRNEAEEEAECRWQRPI